MSPTEPCFHGASNGPMFMMYTLALRTINDHYDSSTVPPKYCKAVDSVLACRNQIPVTLQFSNFLISTAVDALVDGHPNLPPEEARLLTQMALCIEKLAKEQEQKLKFDSEYQQTKYRYSEVFCLDGGANVVPHLVERIPCDCLDNSRGTCFGCHAVVEEKRLKTCTGCETAEYCCQACQRKSWKEQKHKDNCKRIKEIVSIGFKEN